MLELFDENHFFICSGGMKPARFKANQNIASQENGNYYLTIYSLRCKGIDFACRWMALLVAIIAAAMALLMACGVGWILLAAILGAAAGAGLGAMMCGDMAAILRTWVVIKTDAEIQGYNMVPNRPGVHMNCKFFGNQITFAPNVKNEFTALCLFAGNIACTGLEGFMYVYGARGVGLLLSAPKKFLFNFATNYLASLTMDGVVMRTVFAGYSAANAHYSSQTEGFDKERVSNAALDGGLFIERAAWRLYQGVANDGYKDPETGETNWHAVMTDSFMMFSMGGIPAGGGRDATSADVGNMAKQVASEWRHPVETAKAEIGKAVDTAKQFREQLKKLMDGTGANEEVSIIDRVKAMEDVMTEGEKSRTTYSVAKIKLKNGQKEYWVSTAGKKGYVPPRIRKAAGTEKVANNKVENGNSQNRLNDAEQTILREAKEKGVQIEDIGATRDMCNKCQEAFLEEGLIDKVSTPKK